MIFNGKELAEGELISLEIFKPELRVIKAAVIGVRGGVLEVLTPYSMPHRHVSHFTEERVGEITPELSASYAIPQESRVWNKKFHRGERVYTIAQGVYIEGEVVAALDKFIAVRKADGDMFVDRVAAFDPLPKKVQMAM